MDAELAETPPEVGTAAASPPGAQTDFWRPTQRLKL
jgi:hypothetical protein